MQLSKPISNALAKKTFVSFFLLRFVVFPFVTCVNAFIKRKSFLSGKKIQMHNDLIGKNTNVIMFKESASISIFYRCRIRSRFQKHCRYQLIRMSLLQSIILVALSNPLGLQTFYKKIINAKIQ